MNGYQIKIEFVAGLSIPKIVDQALALCQKLDCMVTFDFNGMPCVFYPLLHETAEDVVKRMRAATMSNDSKYFHSS